MAQDRTAIINAINSLLPTTGNEDISALDLRSVLVLNILNNLFSLEEDPEIPVYLASNTYKLGKIVLNQGLLWRAISNVPVSQPPPTLPTQSNTFWVATSVNIPYTFLTGLPNLTLKADLVGGLVPASQLPSYVDDVLVFANLASFPVTGETGKMYLAEDTNVIYRWSGVSYVSVSQIDEASQAEVEDVNTNISNRFVSPRRLWQSFTKFLSTAWTFSEKIFFNKGIGVGNNTTPANGDFWFNNGYFGRQGGVSIPFLTSLNLKLGRVLFVSKEGNNSTAVIGNIAFPYLNIQNAITASANSDTIIIFTGNYNEVLTNPSASGLNFILINATVNEFSFTGSTGATYVGIGNSRITRIRNQGSVANITDLIVDNIVGISTTFNIVRSTINAINIGFNMAFSASNSTFNNIVNTSASISFIQATFNNCTLNNANLTYSTSFTKFFGCIINNCTFGSSGSQRLLLSNCTINGMTFRFESGSTYTYALVLDKCVILGFTFFNSSLVNNNLVLSIDNVITNFDFALLLTTNITQDKFVFDVLPTSVVQKFL